MSFQWARVRPQPQKYVASLINCRVRGSKGSISAKKSPSTAYIVVEEEIAKVWVLARKSLDSVIFWFDYLGLSLINFTRACFSEIVLLLMKREQDLIFF